MGLRGDGEWQRSNLRGHINPKAIEGNKKKSVWDEKTKNCMMKRDESKKYEVAKRCACFNEIGLARGREKKD